MPRGRHAAQHSRDPRQARQGVARIRQAPARISSRRRRKTALCGSLALVTAFSLLIALAATHAAANRGKRCGALETELLTGTAQCRRICYHAARR